MGFVIRDMPRDNARPVPSLALGLFGGFRVAAAGGSAAGRQGVSVRRVALPDARVRRPVGRGCVPVADAPWEDRLEPVELGVVQPSFVARTVDRHARAAELCREALDIVAPQIGHDHPRSLNLLAEVAVARATAGEALEEELVARVLEEELRTMVGI